MSFKKQLQLRINKLKADSLNVNSKLDLLKIQVKLTTLEWVLADED